jgi:hypothetical protein
LARKKRSSIADLCNWSHTDSALYGASIKFSHQQRTHPTDLKEIQMKNAFTSTNKDNVASISTIALAFAIIVSGAFGSSNASAQQRSDSAIQKLDTIVVTASRGVDATLSPMIVKASRSASRN